MMNARRLLTWLTIAATIPLSAPAFAEDAERSIENCLSAWGIHPFGNNPRYRTLAVSVKVFGIGGSTADTGRTDGPALVLVNPGVNVMGETTLELLNPNGWYCLRSNVNVMGNLRIRADCRAHLASAANGATVLGSNPESKGVTVLGSTRIEPVGCEQGQ
jgi:hypothetical protein